MLEPEQRHDGIESCDALDRRLQIVQAVLGDERRDLRADADIAGRLVHDHQPAGLGHRRKIVSMSIGLKVARSMTSALMPRPVEFGGRAQRFEGHCAPRHDGHIAALAQDEAGIERQRLAVIAHFLAHRAIQPHRLEEHHGVGIADCRQQQPIGARRRGRAHDANSRECGTAWIRCFPNGVRVHECRRHAACA